MWTTCAGCKFIFQVDFAMFNKPVKCPRCYKEFMAELTFDPPPPQLNVAEELTKVEGDAKQKAQVLKKEVLERIAIITEKFNAIQSLIQSIAQSNQNESTTKLVIDRILQDVLGYEIKDILMEKDIQGKKADYVLSVQGKPVLVLEAKRVNLALKDKQVIQATTYGAYSGIKWALLTNLQVWQLYHIAFTGDKIVPDLIFSIDLRDGLDRQEAQYFYMFSKHGMENQAFLERLRQKVVALRRENLLSALLSDEVVRQMCTTLNNMTQCKLTELEIRRAIETQIINHT
ncbi:type I restriction enzyme HsdR N-terminal domain-containing protein [Beggiatoa leptomitoformis]|uniref:Type I restriction enzyme R protein N-terminal domain-containing protein n=1 Tax=Beggiatoa leptomitoformis TaxID=288004 RepID=A0A2N9YDA0_9GAMM|nr:type I restriction enzyme HsdR N-terminal domain-containing protein [Beggiatoa leptomitoformis]AUI68441.1 hypothetical protein BLE401_06795 [Beggiatoa leptomitoformis]QGX03850.1 hypothetical protein AL038_17425 [Beggiatoa leptomitoformis]